MENMDSLTNFMRGLEPPSPDLSADDAFGIVSYDFEDGRGPVTVSLKELADRKGLDAGILEDYYCRYRKNLPLALLAALNDQSAVQTYTFLTRLFVPDYVNRHVLERFLSRVNGLLKSQKKIQSQLEYGAALHNRLTLFPGQIDGLLFGRCTNPERFITNEELAFLELLERMSAMTREQRRNLSGQDKGLLEKFLDAASVEELLSGACNLTVTPAAGRVLLELCGKRTTREQNRILYERLCPDGE
ncbi:MAG: hypothetical protein PUC47_06160 [Oscillospiraceae bacterium]|nr:hypothetical protein [Oscillospiraceae bacterium]